MGIGIGVGSFIFDYLILKGQLAQRASIITITPVIVTITSRKVYIDKLTLVQLSGIIVAVAGVLLLAFAPFLHL